MTTAYDAVAYPGFPYAQTHPDRLATQARLFGMDPAPVDRCRVLEIGSGDGGNLLPMALALPGSRFVGIDLAEQPVARATALARDLGLDNVTLLAVDVQDVTEELGRFDYVLSHGVYSWVPPAPRDALLRACGTLLTPHGVAYVSYNAYPGSYVRDMARDLMRFHVDGVEDPAARIAQARGLMQLVVDARLDSPYARMLCGHLERLLSHRDWSLYHDDLAAVNTPVYFHEFMAHAARHGLQFLSESSLAESRLPSVPEHVAAALEELPDDVVVREQYMDFIRNRMFRQTLLCRDDVPLRRTIPLEAVQELSASTALRPASPEPPAGAEAAMAFENPVGARIETADPLMQRALSILAGFWPQAVAFEELVDRARLGAASAHSVDGDRRRLAEALLQAAASGLVELHAHPPRPARRVAERPAASPLARRQAADGAEAVTNLRHEAVRIEDRLARHLLTMLDGTRSRAALERELRAFAARAQDVTAAPGDGLAGALDAALDHLVRVALLTDADGDGPAAAWQLNPAGSAATAPAARR